MNKERSIREIAQAFQAALIHQRVGRLPQGEALYRQVLKEQSNHAQALRYLGVLAHQAGKSAMGIELITAAIGLKPASPMYFNLASALRADGDLGRA